MKRWTKKAKYVQKLLLLQNIKLKKTEIDPNMPAKYDCFASAFISLVICSASRLPWRNDERDKGGE